MTKNNFASNMAAAAFESLNSRGLQTDASNNIIKLNIMIRELRGKRVLQYY